MLWVILLICHEDYLLYFFSTNFCKKLEENLLEWLHVNGCKPAVLNPEGKGIPAESKGLFSYAEVASYGGGAAHSNLPEDNLSS